MTDKEKAQAYDEALNWMRTIHPSLSGADKEDAEHFFPELRESEDERIRKALINYFKAHNTLVGENWNGIECDDVIAYLEKQKEQKPVRAAKEVWKEMRHEVYAQASGNRHEPNYSDDSTKMFSLCDIDEIFEKISNSTVVSQPAEWSEEDEEKLKAICTYLRDYSRLVKLGDKLRFNEYCDFLESLRPQGSKDSLQPHWKPSEEQMGALNYAYYELFKRGDVGHNILGPLQKLCDELRNSNHEEEVH